MTLEGVGVTQPAKHRFSRSPFCHFSDEVSGTLHDRIRPRQGRPRRSTRRSRKRATRTRSRGRQLGRDRRGGSAQQGHNWHTDGRRFIASSSSCPTNCASSASVIPLSRTCRATGSACASPAGMRTGPAGTPSTSGASSSTWRSGSCQCPRETSGTSFRAADPRVSLNQDTVRGIALTVDKGGRATGLPSGDFGSYFATVRGEMRKPSLSRSSPHPERILVGSADAVPPGLRVGPGATSSATAAESLRDATESEPRAYTINDARQSNSLNTRARLIRVVRSGRRGFTPRSTYIASWRRRNRFSAGTTRVRRVAPRSAQAGRGVAPPLPALPRPAPSARMRPSSAVHGHGASLLKLNANSTRVDQALAG